MIDKSKLRIGNVVTHNKRMAIDGSFKQPYTIEQLGEHRAITKPVDKNIFVFYNELRYDEMEGVPLTDELLKQYGFYVKYQTGCGLTNGFKRYKQNFPINNFPEILINDFSSTYTLQYVGTEIKYLHHLQNLYLDLTKEQLVKVADNKPMSDWEKSNKEFTDVFNQVNKNLDSLAAKDAPFIIVNGKEYSLAATENIIYTYQKVNKSFNKILSELIEATKPTPKYRAGGNAAGGFVVGESGPELVFKPELSYYTYENLVKLYKDVVAAMKEKEMNVPRKSDGGIGNYTGKQEMNPIMTSNDWLEMDLEIAKTEFSDLVLFSAKVKDEIQKREKEINAKAEAQYWLRDHKYYGMGLGSFDFGIDEMLSKDYKAAVAKEQSEYGVDNKYVLPGNTRVTRPPFNNTYANPVNTHDIVRRDPVQVKKYRVYDYVTGQLKAKINENLANYITGNKLPTK